MKNFGELLRKHRNNACTLEELAVKVGVTRTTISRWESGKIKPRRSALFREKLLVGFKLLRLKTVEECNELLVAAGLQLSDTEINKLLEISGGHPQLLNKCLQRKLNFPDFDLASYPDVLSQSDDVLQWFIPFTAGEGITQRVIHDWLNQDKVAEWQPYIHDDILRELYWKNLLVKRDKDGESVLYWRCEAIRMAGKKILGG